MFRSNGKWFVGMALGMACLVAPARAQVLLSLNVQRVSDSSSSVTVLPNTPIDYQVVGNLNNTAQHMGLALVGFNLVYNGGALPQANTPTGPLDGTCNNPMVYFVKPTGITNPAGYGGTAGAVGELIQVGGGQNTIKNTAEFADFPVGPVKTGVAQANPPGCGPAVIATGSLVAPATAGVYTLNATQLFANVIEAGQTGTEDFWVTKAAQAGTITPLTITVQPAAVNAVFASATPADEGSLWRNQRNTIRFRFNTADVTAPAEGELLIREMLPNGQFGANLNTGGAFTFTVENEGQGNRVLRIREVGATLQHRKWYDVRNEGAWTGVDPFSVQYLLQVGDFNGDKVVLNADVLAINAAANGARPDQARDDIDGNGFKVQADVLSANSMVTSGPVAKPTGH